VGVITRRYFAGQGDNPVVRHPSREGTFRWLTVPEVRQLHGIPRSYRLPEAPTVAGEVIGNGVVVDFFHRLISAVTERPGSPVGSSSVPADTAGASPGDPPRRAA
jgi:hypothetical protein